MRHEDLMYLIRRANSMGFQRTYIHNIVLPTNTTQSSPEDTIFVVEHESQMKLTATETAPWEK